MAQPTLFQMGKPKLVMTVEDAATSDDRLEQYLERRGYSITTIKALQASISKKKTIDWVSGGTEALTELETAFTEQIEAYQQEVRDQRRAK